MKKSVSNTKGEAAVALSPQSQKPESVAITVTSGGAIVRGSTSSMVVTSVSGAHAFDSNEARAVIITPADGRAASKTAVSSAGIDVKVSNSRSIKIAPSREKKLEEMRRLNTKLMG